MKKTVLAIASNPINTPRLDLDSEIRDLQEAFQRSQHRDRFVFEWRIVKTYEDFRRSILDVKPNIIHFCGHGTNEGLVLADDQNYAKVAGNEVLADLLKLYADRIECFLLNACDTEPLADALVQHLNYVVGMNQPVYDDAAKAFSQSFYDGIGAGDSYETAFEIGRNAVLNKRFGADRTFKVANRKLFAVEQDGEEIEIENQEHLIPVIKVNPNPTTLKPLWLDPEVERQAVRDLLQAIESGFNTIQLFHTDEAIVLKDQYIPVQVTLERRYKHSVEAIGSYAESEAELRQIYAMKGSSEEEIQAEIERQQVDWEEARRQHTRIVVLADPGMGKSTLLRREVVTTIQAAYKALENDKPLQEITIPLFIRLSTLAHKVMQMPMLEAILESIQEDELCYRLLRNHKDTEVMAFLNAYLEEQLLEGKGLLLLDALDEVPDGNRQKLLEKLNGFAKAYPTCPIVGTSRIVGYGGRLVDGSKDMEIVPFTQKQTAEYIKIWFEKAPLKDKSVSAQGLIKALRERPQLAGLAQNPLLLSLICSLYQRDQLTLPARRSQIYEQAVNCMLGEWNQTRLDNDKDRTTAKIRLLEELAYHFTSEGQEVFDYGDLYDWMESYLEDGDAPRDLQNDKTGKLIAELSEEDGILQKLYRDKSDDQYLFLHRTFQEYFTASYLKRSLKKNKKNPAYVTELVRNYCWNYDWHETLTLLAGLMDNPMVFIEAIAAEKDDIFQTQLLLAGRCLAECRELSHPLVDKIIDRIYQFWLAYPDAEFIQSVVVAIGQTSTTLVQAIQHSLKNSSLRYIAIHLLEQISNEKAVDSLLQALSDTELYVRSSAAESLGNIGNEKAVDGLLQARSDIDSKVRRSATEALVQIGNEKAVDGLFQALSDTDLGVRLNAEKALVQIGNEKVVNRLLQALFSTDSLVRASTAFALGQIGNEKAVGGLLQALSDTDSFVRRSAAESLGKIGNEKAVNSLLQALSDTDLRVRLNAAEALGKIGNEKAVDSLLQVLSDEALSDEALSDEALSEVEFYVRRSAAFALGQIGNEKAVDGLLQALSDTDSDVRTSAIETLGQIGNEKAVDGLLQALSDTDSGVRASAIEALGQIGNEKAVDGLLQALSNADSDVQDRATESLVKIGNEKAVDGLLQALTDADSDVRVRAAFVLVLISNAKVADGLFETIPDIHSSVRARAAEALVQIDNEKIVDSSLQALSGTGSSVTIAAHVLVKIGNEKAVDGLLQALSDIDSDVRRSAAESLGNIGNEKAVDGLLQALSDIDSDVRRSAAESLGNIGNEKAVDSLLQALSDIDSDVRRSAAESLGNIGNEKAVDGLLQALSDTDLCVRRNAAKSLVQIGNEKAVGGLLQALSDTDSDVRTSAVGALGQIGNEKAVDGLLQALSDTDSDVRTSAVGALGQIGNEKAVDGLLQALSNADSDVQDRAIEALGNIGNAACLEKLIQAADSRLIYDSKVFLLARRWAVRFSKAGLPFIPVYSELVSASPIPHSANK